MSVRNYAFTLNKNVLQPTFLSLYFIQVSYKKTNKHIIFRLFEYMGARNPITPFPIHYKTESDSFTLFTAKTAKCNERFNVSN